MNCIKFAAFSLFVITGCTRNYYIQPSKAPETCIKPATQTFTSTPKFLIKAIEVKKLVIANFDSGLHNLSCDNWSKVKYKNDQIQDYYYNLVLTEFNKSYFTEQELLTFDEIAYILTGLKFKIDHYHKHYCG